MNYQQLLKRSRNGVALFWDITDRSKQSLSLGLPGGALTSTVCPRGGCSNYIPNLRGGEPERNIRGERQAMEKLGYLYHTPRLVWPNVFSFH